MPQLDGTGPQGMGPRTGRGFGHCEDCAKCFAEETDADSLLGQENRKMNKLPSAQKQKNENKNCAS